MLNNIIIVPRLYTLYIKDVLIISKVNICIDLSII